MKQEIIEERQAGEENPKVGTTEEVLRDLPPPVETEEVLIKQEWIEMCEQRRPPVKQKYQLQFRETMRLKMEVRNLRKEVQRMQK